MIQLNVDGIGFVRVDSWDDIESIPGYTEDLHISDDEKLSEVIGVYDFPLKIRCGISTCHQQHNKGYIVKTVSGSVTNIGNVCGRKIFNVEFKEKKKIFDRDLADSGNREKLWLIRNQLDGYDERLAGVLDGNAGAVALERKLRAFKGSNYRIPREVGDFLRSAVRTRDSVIYHSRVATADEVAIEEALIGRRVQRPYYVSEPICVVDGIESLHGDSDLKKILISDLKVNFSRLREMDIDSATSKELKDMALWSGKIEELFEKAEVAIGYCRRFLDKNNLNKLLNIELKRGKDREHFVSVIKESSI
ncbi:hypothetical protein [Thalassolituus sp. C2-1]|uniref:hypothetical protein n=1 Tax=Venatorbacter sp. C2-1 TaxID=2597518 RepID=UPI0011921CCE|nr:hypothetical protein [Thalassolituus sp. C2-1]TVV45475.1 hypothetical protein FOT50_01150 [Thalassolituus sp. C2-1]